MVSSNPIIVLGVLVTSALCEFLGAHFFCVFTSSLICCQQQKSKELSNVSSGSVENLFAFASTLTLTLDTSVKHYRVRGDIACFEKSQRTSSVASWHHRPTSMPGWASSGCCSEVHGHRSLSCLETHIGGRHTLPTLLALLWLGSTCA